MIIQLAIATQTSPAAWRDEDDATIATVLDELAKQAEEAKKSGR
jgi:hypothetical protein